MTEIQEKLKRLRTVLEVNGLDAALLNRNPNFAWLTGGAVGYVNSATDMAAASLLVTPTGHYVLANNIEAARLEAEERLADLGFEFRVAPWYEGNPAAAALTQGLRLGADGPMAGATDISAAVADLRMNLLPQELERYRKLGQACGDAMDTAMHQVRPGLTEYQIAGLLAHALLDRGILPIVNLIATDERIFRFRHPLPTSKVLDRYAMLVLCGRQAGLVASVTRLIHFGPLPEELQRKQAACALVDATLIHATRPGRSLVDIFQDGLAAYAGAGFPDEWQLHHQGGPAGYEPREFVATPALAYPVAANQAYAWNPSITGVKCEDTILIGPDANEIITTMPGWPMLSVDVAGMTYQRPAILVA
jgi:Xaa-Pro aminopeptidase